MPKVRRLEDRRHVHFYLLINLTRKRGKEPYHVFQCIDSCKHYIPQALALGRTTQCWGCREPFVMDGYAVERVRPRCSDCIKKKIKAEDSKLLRNFDVDKMLADLSEVE